MQGSGTEKFLFNRQALVDGFLNGAADDEAVDDGDKFIRRSYYIRGARGMGKTVFMCLIGRELQRRGHVVVFVKNTGQITKYLEERDFVELEKLVEPGKELYLLVDEVQENPSDADWTYLLRESNVIVTIGAGIPSLSERSPPFSVKFGPTFLSLTSRDLDDAVVEHFRALSEDLDEATVRALLAWLLDFTGGHTFPFVRLAHHLVTKERELCRRSDWEGFFRNMYASTRVFKEVGSRCFDVNDGILARAASEIFDTRPVSHDTHAQLSDLGLWKGKLDGSLMSRLLITHTHLANPYKDEGFTVDWTS